MIFYAFHFSDSLPTCRTLRCCCLVSPRDGKSQKKKKGIIIITKRGLHTQSRAEQSRERKVKKGEETDTQKSMSPLLLQCAKLLPNYFLLFFYVVVHSISFLWGVVYTNLYGLECRRSIHVDTIVLFFISYLVQWRIRTARVFFRLWWQGWQGNRDT